MTTQYTDGLRDAGNNAIRDAIGASPTLTIRTGSMPATAGAAATGTVLVTMTLPATWLSASSGGVMSKVGAWSDPSADASGTAGYYRITGGGQTIQGTVSGIGGGGGLQLVTTAVVAGQPVEIVTFTHTMGGA